MRNPFKRPESGNRVGARPITEPQPAPEPQTALAPEPAPVTSPEPTPTRAISNLDPYGLPPEVSGLRGQEMSFPSKEAAIAWLRNLRCGGAISYHNGKDFQSERVAPPG